MAPRRRQTLAALLGVAGALPACRNAALPRAFVLDDGVKMSADGRLMSLVDLPGYAKANPAWDGGAITLAGARGETVAFQVMVQAGARDLPGATVSVSDLRRDGGGVIAAERLTRFREWYVAVTVPSASPGGSAGKGEYPDALVPADTPGFGLPVDVPAARTQGIWVDCAIPAAAAAGTYRGALVVSAGGAELARFDVRLEVHGFALPVERHLPWRIGYSGWESVPARLGIAEGSAGWLELEKDLYRLVWEGHRAVPTTHYHDLRLETRGAGAALRIDWARFDRRFGGYLDGSAFESGQPVNAFSLPVNLHRGWPFRLGPDPAAVDAGRLAALSRLVARHWDEKGWRLADAFAYVADEPGRDRIASVRKACAAIHQGDPRIRTSVALYTELGRDARGLVKELAGHVTSWELAGDYADLPALRERQAAGDRLGLYQGGEPYEGGEAVDDDGLALTTWPWIAWRYGLDSLFLYNMTEWDYARLDRANVPWAKGKREIWENPLNQSWATNSQGVLLYPGPYVGRKGVVASIRLKQVRRGLQDYEYLWLARRGGDGPKADEISRRLVPRALHEAGPLGKVGRGRGAWERDPRAWAAARLELARAIEARSPQRLVEPPSENPARSLPSTRAPSDGAGGMRRALE
ncbi:MAG TPA: glycoside hydrolase domain-containing protein [Anaeromyxobacter sp.]